ncbi:MAG: hypothetical protein BA870_04270 [Desulfuromonadales bacterium C00003094]|nr:MAG: hypothetical protein BA870_04270 [Desulfuromonadales bacterium C00003094]
MHRIQSLDAFRIFLNQSDALLRVMSQFGTGRLISYSCNSTLYFESLLEASNQSGAVAQPLQRKLNADNLLGQGFPAYCVIPRQLRPLHPQHRAENVHRALTGNAAKFAVLFEITAKNDGEAKNALSMGNGVEGG